MANLPAAYSANSRSPPLASPKSSSSTPDKRPEKSNAAAGRLIAGALGVKVKKTEEGVRYEKAVREKEKKRRERVKEEEGRAEREAEDSKRAVWEG